MAGWLYECHCGELRVLVGDKWDMTWPWAMTAQEAKCVLGSSHLSGQQGREGMLPPLLCFPETPLPPAHPSTDMELVEQAQRGPLK